MSFIKKLNVKKSRYKFFTIAFFILFFFVYAHAQAATLALSPSSGNYTVGRTISVRVLVNSGGQSINAVSGQVTFSNDTLVLEGISKSGIVTLWAQDPTYSNANGSASFQGVILNGYSGGSGTVVTLSFRAKAQGTATVGISSSGSSVLLNDGQGTNALSGTSGASFSIGPSVVTAATQPQPVPAATVPAEIAPPPVLPLIAKGATPLFTSYQSPLLPGNFVVVKGTASPDSTVTITFTQTAQNGTTTVSQISLPTGDDGSFTFVSDTKVTEGSSYIVVANTPDGQHTTPLNLVVKNTMWFIIVTLITTLFAIRISAWLALLLILIISGYLLYRNSVLKKRLNIAIEKLHTPEQK